MIRRALGERSMRGPGKTAGTSRRTFDGRQPASARVRRQKTAEPVQRQKTGERSPAENRQTALLFLSLREIGGAPGKCTDLQRNVLYRAPCRGAVPFDGSPGTTQSLFNRQFSVDS
jgi:hypothetical protein